MLRYIRKKNDDYVLDWSPALAARDDMVECDRNGNEVVGGGGALPKVLLEAPVPVVVPPPVETPVPQIETPAPRVEASAAPIAAPVVAVDLDAMTVPQLRAFAKARGYKIDMRLGASNMRKAIREASGDF